MLINALDMVNQYIECKSGTCTMVTNYKLRLCSINIPNYSCLIGEVAQGTRSTIVGNPLGFCTYFCVK